MDAYARHQWVWRALRVLLLPWIRRRFRYECDPIPEQGPILLIANHVTSFDPFLVAIALGGHYAYFVATEQILRGFFGGLIQWLVDPIPRKKGASSLDTVRKCVKHFRAGHSVCLFGEGEQSWDGRSVPVVEGTGSLARMAGVKLVTYRLEGGYLSRPRWGKSQRKGRVRGRLTGIYAPEALQAMTTREVNALINRDIGENAWARQEKDRTPCPGRNLAEHLEKLLYLCPNCRKVGTLQSRGDRIMCPCGLSARYLDTGFFENNVPFPHLAAWEDWQKECLSRRDFLVPEGATGLFGDTEARLSQIGDKHSARLLGVGTLAQEEECLSCAGRRFPLGDISDMAMTRSNVLLFTCGGGYYEIRVSGNKNLRKYLEIWKESKPV